MLARKVYANGKQYGTEPVLEESILCNWLRSIDESIHSQISYMPARCQDVFRGDEGSISY